MVENDNKVVVKALLVVIEFYLNYRLKPTKAFDPEQPNNFFFQQKKKKHK